MIRNMNLKEAKEALDNEYAYMCDDKALELNLAMDWDNDWCIFESIQSYIDCKELN